MAPLENDNDCRLSGKCSKKGCISDNLFPEIYFPLLFNIEFWEQTSFTQMGWLYVTFEMRWGSFFFITMCCKYTYILFDDAYFHCWRIYQVTLN